MEATGLGLVALDVLVFLAIYRPLRDQVDREARRHAGLRQSVRNEQVRVDLLKKFEAALPHTAKGLEDFTTQRTPSRREAYSTAAHLVHKVADASGVKVSSMTYRLDTEHNDPLERLALEIDLEGSYTGLLKFSHSFETVNDFILIREFVFTPGNGGLGLRLGADLYLTP